MTKRELIFWLENNPRHQQQIEKQAGLSHGYLWRLKTKSINPSKATLKSIETAIREINVKII